MGAPNTLLRSIWMMTSLRSQILMLWTRSVSSHAISQPPFILLHRRLPPLSHVSPLHPSVPSTAPGGSRYETKPALICAPPDITAWLDRTAGSRDPMFCFPGIETQVIVGNLYHTSFNMPLGPVKQSCMHRRSTDVDSRSQCLRTASQKNCERGCGGYN
jgi:hypothetical protein